MFELVAWSSSVNLLRFTIFIRIWFKFSSQQLGINILFQEVGLNFRLEELYHTTTEIFHTNWNASETVRSIRKSADIIYSYRHGTDDVFLSYAGLCEHRC